MEGHGVVVWVGQPLVLDLLLNLEHLCSRREAGARAAAINPAHGHARLARRPRQAVGSLCPAPLCRPSNPPDCSSSRTFADHGTPAFSAVLFIVCRAPSCRRAGRHQGAAGECEVPPWRACTAVKLPSPPQHSSHTFMSAKSGLKLMAALTTRDSVSSPAADGSASPPTWPASGERRRGGGHAARAQPVAAAHAPAAVRRRLSDEPPTYPSSRAWPCRPRRSRWWRRWPALPRPVPGAVPAASWAGLTRRQHVAGCLPLLLEPPSGSGFAAGM